MIKLTIDLCHKIAKDRRGKCLSEAYINAHSKLEWECSESHTWFAALSDIKNKRGWCPKCVHNTKRASISDCVKAAKLRGGKCLSTEYKDSKTKMLWECSLGHKWETNLGMIHNGKWCRKCGYVKSGLSGRIGLDKCREIARERGGKCLSTKYVGNKVRMKWQCEVGHMWLSSLNSVKDSNTWCRICSAKNRIHPRKRTLDDCHTYASSKGGTCLATEYINGSVKIGWKCSEGHIWMSRPNSMRSDNNWCPVCLYPVESAVREIFETLFLTDFKSVRPKFLINPKIGKPLELDGYCPELNLAFEYDGEFHYQIILGGQERLNKQKERDAIKNSICRENNIKLIRIPYWEKKNLRPFILRELSSLGYNFPLKEK